MTRTGGEAAPLYFGPRDRPLFGWFHAGRAERAAGVVLCSAIGDDGIRAHRALRHLAERLSAAGFAVLRFDFGGTGDSAGDEREPGRARGWLDEIGAAVAELRERSGARAVGLVGLRLGATLAMAAAAGLGGVESLVLWGPYPDGEAFVRDATRRHELYRLLEPARFAGAPRSHPTGREALGFFLTSETIRELGAIDLLRVHGRPAARALVIGTSDDVLAEGPLLQRLGALGTDTAYRHLPGHAFLVATPHHAVIPEAALDAITAWLDQAHSATAPESPPPPARTGPAEMAPVGPDRATPASERAVRFGAQGRLFGILTPGEPEGAAADRPGIILVNAGTVHRVGPHRMYVGLARRLAALGFPVLRVDLSGIGDSAARPGCAENLCYPRDAVADVAAAMDATALETGARRFVLMGLCSGADLAFQTALADGRAAGVVLLNPRTFLLGDLGAVGDHEKARYYQGSALRAESWKKALRGEVDLVRAARQVLPGLGGALGRARHLLAPTRRGAEEVEAVPRRLRSLARRGVDTFLLVTAGDPGLDYLDARCGEAMRALSTEPGFRRADVPGTDHTFTSASSLALVSDLVVAHLLREHPGVIPAHPAEAP